MALFLKKRDFEIPESGIDSVERVKLGGVEQSILIQAVDPTKPVLLFVHGGPCMPVPGIASRGQDITVATATKELVKHYVLVFWDQRGAGKSYSSTIPSESFRVEQFVNDCLELIDYLRNRFKKEKIVLAAHSWGTIIGLSVATRAPEKLEAYFGISQIMNWAENDLLCYEWVMQKAEAAGDKRTLKKLQKLGKPPYINNVKQWTDFRLPLMKYNSMVYQSETVKHSGMKGGMLHFLLSSEYSTRDIFHTFYSAYKLTYTQELIEDFAKINFHKLKKIDVPVFFLHGRYDVHVASDPVTRFYENVEAPNGKELIWYEKSSHMFYPEDAKEIEKLLIARAPK